MAQQLILPMIPHGATEINNHISAWRGEDRWTYFLGTHPIYSHHANDDRGCRLPQYTSKNTGYIFRID